MVRNRILRFFSSKNGSDWNSVGFSLLRNGSEWNSEGFSLSRNGSERNSEGFSLPRNGLVQNSEVFLFQKMVWNGILRVFLNGLVLNSEVFLFCETGGIPTELPSVPSCSAFRGIIFCQKMATLIHGES
jgi:hypothetical protein